MHGVTLAHGIGGGGPMLQVRLGTLSVTELESRPPDCKAHPSHRVTGGPQIQPLAHFCSAHE